MNETRGEAISKLTSIERAIERAGLAPRGALRLNDAERVGALAPFRTLVLVGMIGGAELGRLRGIPGSPRRGA